MKKIISISLLFVATLSASTASTVELRLKEPYHGRSRLTGEKISLSKSEVVLKIDGKHVTIQRDNVEVFKFLTDKTASKSDQQQQLEVYRGKLPSQPKATTAGKMGSTNTKEDANPKDLNTKESREQFKQIQAQMMAQYKGRPGYDKAIKDQNDMYQALASGNMTATELQAKASSVSAEASSYSAQETAEYPELQSLLQVLNNFSAE